MTLPVYPRGTLDHADRFSRVMGSFWKDIAGEPDRIEALFAAYGVCNEQANITTTEAKESISRLTVPLYRQRLWYCLTLKESDRNSAIVRPLTYGPDQAYYGDAEGGVYPYNRPFVYGDAISGIGYRFPIPTGLRKAQQVANTVRQASVLWINQLDFIVTDTYIEFRLDPFATTDFVTRSTVTNEVADRELDVWLYRADFEDNDIYELFGYVMGVNGDSSPEYRNMVNAVWDAHVKGTSDLVLKQALSAAAGVPLVTSNQTVKAVISHPLRQQVITDTTVYDYSPDDTLTVAVDDTVTAGQWMSDTLGIAASASVGDLLDDVTGLTLTRDLVNLPLRGGLTFRNASVATVYDVDDDGVVTVTFTLDGFQDDIDLFWAAAKAYGIETGRTVANALRTDPGTGQPAESQIKPTVNPMEFLLQEVLTSNLLFVRIKRTLSQGGMGLGALSFLRRIMPAHSMMLFLIEITIPDEIYNEGTPYDDGYVGLQFNTASEDVLTAPVDVGPKMFSLGEE